MDEWITCKEAAYMLGYSTAYFRELYCNKDNPLVKMRVHTQTLKSRRRILIHKPSLMALIAKETVQPAC